MRRISRSSAPNESSASASASPAFTSRREAFEPLLGERQHDRVAVREEVVERADADAGGRRDAIGGERLVAAALENPSAAAEDRVEAGARARLARELPGFPVGHESEHTRAIARISSRSRPNTEESCAASSAVSASRTPGRSGWPRRTSRRRSGTRPAPTSSTASTRSCTRRSRTAPPGREAELTKQAPALAALFREGYDPALEPERLEALPDGTLGREYARFIRANQIDPLGNLLALSRPKNLLEYQFWRSYKLHDVLHVVLGCDASVLGEVPIVAYSLGQARSTGVRAPALALCVLLLHMALRKPEQFQTGDPARRRVDAARRADAQAYASHRLEDWMERPVEEVRALVLAAA